MSSEQLGFKAEVQQLLDLMIHAVYSNRDVFLRELVSNAADALDKARFLGLTRSDLLAPPHEEPGIWLSFDAEAGTLVIEDDGVGMTRDEAIKNLGTIAHSGTKAFLAEAKSGEGASVPSLIGQFGVGFYSAFMVASKVEVDTRSAEPDSVGVRWTSEGAGVFTVDEIEREHRGTRITLHLRDDAKTYADDLELRRVVREHSAYVPWPIHLDGEAINTPRALWSESPSSVTDEEAFEFYKMLTFDFEEPALRVHFQVDTPHQYSALLFVPKNRPYDLFVPEADRGPRLYARKVLIDEHARDLLPDWLRFVRGVVDSQDIPLNMSREMVQKTPVVRAIRDALVKRILKELGKLADQAKPEDGEHPYHGVWNAFGVLLKEGFWHDRAAHGERLMPLLRFRTMLQEGLVSLAEYLAARPEGQDAIWYYTASSREAALVAPHLEAFRAKGWDVLVLTDPVDEWLVQVLTEFEGVPLKSVSRGELSLDDEGGERADLAGLGPWMEGLFAGSVGSVRASTRLTSSPAVLVDDDHGVSANMERILRSAQQEVPVARRHLELNVKHPLVLDLVKLHEAGVTEVAEPIARLLLDEARLLEGSVQDAPGIGRRVQAVLEELARRALPPVPVETATTPAA